MGWTVATMSDHERQQMAGIRDELNCREYRTVILDKAIPISLYF